MSGKKIGRSIIFILLFLGALSIIFSPLVKAQNWTALPPYNTLWPLWSSSLSPVDPVTGDPTPIVTRLVPTTVLPVQPCLTWDPSYEYPYLLYNTPSGIVYYDPAQGVNLWPPNYHVEAGAAAPLSLTRYPPYPYNIYYPYLYYPYLYGSYYQYYSYDPITSWLLDNLQTANLSYIESYTSFTLIPSITSLLTYNALVN